MTTTSNIRPCGCAGHGRHKDACPLKNDAVTELGAATITETWYDLPCLADDEMEQYGGDLAAHESYADRNGRTMSRRPMASIRSAQPAAHPQPDLNHKGLLVYRHAFEKRFHFAYLAEDGSPNYQQAVQTLRQRGYKPVTVADFYVHSTLRDGVFESEDGTANGRLTLGGAKKGATTVIYRQDEVNYFKWRDWDRRFTDQIQKTAEQQAAEMQDAWQRDGIGGVGTTARIEFD